MTSTILLILLSENPAEVSHEVGTEFPLIEIICMREAYRMCFPPGPWLADAASMICPRIEAVLPSLLY